MVVSPDSQGPHQCPSGLLSPVKRLYNTVNHMRNSNTLILLQTSAYPLFESERVRIFLPFYFQTGFLFAEKTKYCIVSPRIRVILISPFVLLLLIRIQWFQTKLGGHLHLTLVVFRRQYVFCLAVFYLQNNARMQSPPHRRPHMRCTAEPVLKMAFPTSRSFPCETLIEFQESRIVEHTVMQIDIFSFTDFAMVIKDNQV